MFLVPGTICPRRSARIIPGGLWPCPQAQPVAIHRGQAWITQAGDPRDHLVGPGEVWRPQGSGRVVVQALGADPVELTLGLSAP